MTTRLAGLVLPGFANAHSHAFHRALRGRTHDGGGTFWTWREQMYAVAARLDPDSYLALARADYAEMALAGVTCVGEFHYLHHRPGGGPYADPNAMARGAASQAAADAGIRITLLDTCYLAGGLDAAATCRWTASSVRFSDGDADAWAARVGRAARAADGCGSARRSTRCGPCPRDAAADRRRGGRAGGPLHVHLSEQPAENEACRAFYGSTPTELLAAARRARAAHHRGARHPPHRRRRRSSRRLRDHRLRLPDHRARPRRRGRARPGAARRRVAARAWAATSTR